MISKMFVPLDCINIIRGIKGITVREHLPYTTYYSFCYFNSVLTDDYNLCLRFSLK